MISEGSRARESACDPCARPVGGAAVVGARRSIHAAVRTPRKGCAAAPRSIQPAGTAALYRATPKNRRPTCDTPAADSRRTTRLPFTSLRSRTAGAPVVRGIPAKYYSGSRRVAPSPSVMTHTPCTTLRCRCRCSAAATTTANRSGHTAVYGKHEQFSNVFLLF